MSYILPIAMVISGVVVGILIGMGKAEAQALLFVGPVIMLGCFLTAIAYVRRKRRIQL